MKAVFLRAKKNSGMSLVELIVVIAIIAVLTGTISLGFSVVSTRSATQCAENMRISLNRNRMTTMGKQRGFIAFIRRPDGIYMIEKFDDDALAEFNDSDSSAVKIGKKDVQIYFGEDDTGTEWTSGTLKYVFKRSDGSLDKDASSYIPLTIKKGSRSYTLDIQSLTGKVTLVRK